jgi:hypothetical protein
LTGEAPLAGEELDSSVAESEEESAEESEDESDSLLLNSLMPFPQRYLDRDLDEMSVDEYYCRNHNAPVYESRWLYDLDYRRIFG